MPGPNGSMQRRGGFSTIIKSSFVLLISIIMLCKVGLCNVIANMYDTYFPTRYMLSPVANICTAVYIYIILEVLRPLRVLLGVDPLGPSGMLDFVLHALRVLSLFDPRNGAMIG